MADDLRLALAPPDTVIDRRTDGTVLLRTRAELRPHPQRLGDVLTAAAEEAPDTVFLAERRGDDWARITYATALTRAQAVAQFLLDRGFDTGSAVAILSGNSIEHALVAIGAALIGVPVVPVTPAYSLASRDHRRLRAVVDLLQPGMVFADDGDAFGSALAAVACPDRVTLTGSGNVDRPGAIHIDEVWGSNVQATRLERRMAEVTPRTPGRDCGSYR